MRLRLMAVSSTIILAGCVPRAGSDYHFDPNPAPPVAKGSQIPIEHRLVVETPNWSPASVELYARRVVTSIYQVQSGDSLFSIANKTGGGATTIANANKLMPPYTLQLGHLGRLDVTKAYRVPLANWRRGRNRLCKPAETPFPTPQKPAGGKSFKLFGTY